MPLFLYNFTTRELHGIFTAASDGEWEIDAYGARPGWLGWLAGWPAPAPARHPPAVCVPAGSGRACWRLPACTAAAAGLCRAAAAC